MLANQDFGGLLVSRRNASDFNNIQATKECAEYSRKLR